MKILIINGRPRKAGHISYPESERIGHLTLWNGSTSMSFLPDHVSAVRNASWTKCVFLKNDDAHQVGHQISVADFLIVGSPTYQGNMTGPPKILFDRNVPTFEYVDGTKIKKTKYG